MYNKLVGRLFNNIKSSFICRKGKKIKWRHCDILFTSPTTTIHTRKRSATM